MRVAVIGGVKSTWVLLSKLAEHQFREVGVWGYHPTDPTLVSGWVDLSIEADRLGFAFQPFTKVAECHDQVAAFRPDLLFVVGLSQIIPDTTLALARKAAVGFHPTALPKGRGRAPIAWLILEQEDGAATFFALRSGVDDGPIYEQESFSVGPEDDAGIVLKKVLDAQTRALDRLLPALWNGDAEPVEQNHAEATWYGIRRPEDGLIDWRDDAEAIVRLVRATTRPHPGAYCDLLEGRVIVWRAEVDNRPFRGVTGRILEIDDDTILVQAGKGLVRLTEWTIVGELKLRVGRRLSLDADEELKALRRRVQQLEKSALRLHSKGGYQQ